MYFIFCKPVNLIRMIIVNYTYIVPNSGWKFSIVFITKQQLNGMHQHLFKNIEIMFKIILNHPSDFSFVSFFRVKYVYLWNVKFGIFHGLSFRVPFLTFSYRHKLCRIVSSSTNILENRVFFFTLFIWWWSKWLYFI